MHPHLCRSMLFSINKQVNFSEFLDEFDFSCLGMLKMVVYLNQITCTIRKTSSRGFTNSVKLHHALPSRCTPKRNFTSNLPRFLVWDTQIGVRHLSLTAPGRNLSDGPSLHSVAFVASEAKLVTTMTTFTAIIWFNSSYLRKMQLSSI